MHKKHKTRIVVGSSTGLSASYAPPPPLTEHKFITPELKQVTVKELEALHAKSA